MNARENDKYPMMGISTELDWDLTDCRPENLTYGSRAIGLPRAKLYLSSMYSVSHHFDKSIDSAFRCTQTASLMPSAGSLIVLHETEYLFIFNVLTPSTMLLPVLLSPYSSINICIMTRYLVTSVWSPLGFTRWVSTILRHRTPVTVM